MKPTARLASVTSAVMERNKRWAARHVRASTTPKPVQDRDTGGLVTNLDGTPLLASDWDLRPWKERSIADVAALKLTEMHEAGERASKAGAAPAQLQVVIIPERIADARAWEAKARALEVSGRPVIEVSGKTPESLPEVPK